MENDFAYNIKRTKLGNVCVFTDDYGQYTTVFLISESVCGHAATRLHPTAFKPTKFGFVGWKEQALDEIKTYRI